ncbi:LptF/LptG family permease, partial [Plesiomonas shigelloides]
LGKESRAHVRAELRWRVSLKAAVAMLGLLVMPLAAVKPRQGRVANVGPALLLYLIYCWLQSALKSWLGNGRMDSAVWIWGTNGGFLLLEIILNMWDSIPMRRLRAQLKGAQV